MDIKPVDSNEARERSKTLWWPPTVRSPACWTRKELILCGASCANRRWPRIVELAKALGETLPDDPSPKALSDFLKRRRLADPTHFSDLSLSILKLLDPGEYVVVKSGEEHEGQFCLTVHDYTHSTAPNRRFPDLVSNSSSDAVSTIMHLSGLKGSLVSIGTLIPSPYT